MLLNKRLLAAPYGLLAGILFVALGVVVALTYDKYGFTTDEALDYLKAVRVIEFIGSLGNIDHVSNIDDINIHGAMPDLVAWVLQRLIPVLSFDSRHLVSALFGVGGIYYAYRLGSAFVAPAVGFFAALFLACNPMWFGYMFINAKDIPFAAALLAAFYYCLCALTGRELSPWIWLKTGLAVGILATTKVIGVLVLGFFVAETLAVFAFIPGPTHLRIDSAFFGRLLKTALWAIIGCLVCFAAFWPQFFLWKPAQLVNVVSQFMSFESWSGNVLVGGQYFSADHVPWYYMTTYFIISMPLFLVALTLAGAAYGALKRNALILSCTIACVAFFGYQAVTGAHVAFNGYRHFLFLLPLATLLAAYPVGCVCSGHFPSIVRAMTLVLAGVGALSAIVSMYRLFPYQYSFYNVLVGGLPGADGKYEIDVWRSALREALRQIDKIPHPDGVVRVGACGSTINFAAYPNFRPVGEAEGPDYIVVQRRCLDLGMSRVPAWPLVGEIRREGVLLAATYSRPTM